MAEKSIGALKTSGDGIKKGTEKEDRIKDIKKENVGKIKQEKWCKTIQKHGQNKESKSFKVINKEQDSVNIKENKNTTEEVIRRNKTTKRVSEPYTYSLLVDLTL